MSPQRSVTPEAAVRLAMTPTVPSLDVPVAQNADAAPTAPAVPYSFPAAFAPGHFVRAWIDYAQDCTDAAHAYHEANALVLLATCTPRLRARFGPYPKGLRTNLFVLDIGDSTTSRRSTAKNLALDVLEQAIPDTIGPDAASPEGLVEELAHRSGDTITLLIDEFAELLDKLHHAKYMAGFRGLLLSMYDGIDHRYKRHSKRIKGGGTVEDQDWVRDPYLSIIGCTTPTIFEDLTSKDVRCGLLPRFAIVMPTTKPRRKGFHEIQAPDERQRTTLVQWALAIYVWATTAERAVHFEPGTLQDLDAFAEETEQQASRLDPVARTMLMRIDTMAVKVAMLSAVGRPGATDQEALTVTRDDATAALAVVRRWRADAVAFVGRIGETEFEQKLQRAFGVVTTKGGSVPRQVVAKMVHTDSRVMDLIQATLVDRGLIRVAMKPAPSGPAETVWELP